jgi:hypothetical protein
MCRIVYDATAPCGEVIVMGPGYPTKIFIGGR